MSACYGTLDSDRGHAARTRRGFRWMDAVAKTWKTRVIAHIKADGSGNVTVIQNGDTIHQFAFGPESTEAKDLGQKILNLPTRQRNKILTAIENTTLVNKLDKVI